nr:acetyl-CoA carboxylase biotin carboxylase subunit [Planctomycetota bacterium]
MFHRVFIANRGEVAARMARACRALGIEPVCGASEADLAAGFPYLEEAAQTVRLGPGPASESYLRIETVIQAAKQSGCSAVHPGWGFLAENAGFAALCEQHGLKFIGPSPAVMDQMGPKVASRQGGAAARLPGGPGMAGALGGAAGGGRGAGGGGGPGAPKAGPRRGRPGPRPWAGAPP